MFRSKCIASSGSLGSGRGQRWRESLNCKFGSIQTLGRPAHEPIHLPSEDLVAVVQGDAHSANSGGEYDANRLCKLIIRLSNKRLPNCTLSLGFFSIVSIPFKPRAEEPVKRRTTAWLSPRENAKEQCSERAGKTLKQGTELTEAII